MPMSLVYLFVMLAVICIWFILLKRPIWESMGVSLVVLVAITGTWGSLGDYIEKGMSTSLLYSMVVFICMSAIMTKTKLIDGAVNLILALLGRLPGGAGYAAVVASSFMGALSGSGPGNVMSTGVITIKAMKDSGYPPELAANVESNASYLGNMIPPSANIVAALGALTAFWATNGMDDTMSIGSFWMVCWGCSLWFILSKLIVLFIFCKVYKIRPMEPEKIPSFRETLRENWQGLLLPFIILVPFIVDFIFNNATAFPGLAVFVDRLGKTGAKNYSSSLLFFVAGLAAIYAVIVMLFKDKSKVSPKNLIRMLSGSAKGIATTVGTCLFGYMIGALFSDIGATDELGVFLEGLNMGRVGLAFVIPLITCFMGMVIPGSSLVSIFGALFIGLFYAQGANPVMVAAMLPCFCGVMCGITPPLALGMYAGMSIAESDPGKTIKNDLWWVAAQYILEVIVLLGWLPILGL
ncbi:MAG: TRAP transporter large permease subunit [Clostridia bacterium]|nr:TRAP transporter large permease subunit [Clostridia bacterium]